MPGAHDIEAEPANGEDPGAERQERDIADRQWVGFAVEIAALARAEDQDCRKCQPAAEKWRFCPKNGQLLRK